MDDYEITNAREWDINYRHPTAAPVDEVKILTSVPTRSTHRARIQPSYKPVYRHATAPTSRAHEWHIVEGSRRHEQTRNTTDLLVDIDDGGDNAAQTSWRKHERPVDSVSIPSELLWLNHEHEQIARSHGTFICSQQCKLNNGPMRFEIWGTALAVAATKQGIHDWVNSHKSSKRALGEAKFAKAKSLLPRQRQSEEKLWLREVAKQRYRQFPPFGSTFGAIGTFRWPVQDYQPAEALGSSYEALDPIRMDCSCYVVFEKELHSFQVMGDLRNVTTALVRIRKVCFQIAARQLSSARRYLLHFKSRQAVPEHVLLAPYENTRILRPEGALVIKHGQSPRGCNPVKQAASLDQPMTSSTRSLRLVKNDLLKRLACLHYYRGHLELRIRLGKFLATQYRVPTDGLYELEDFHEMLKQSQFEAKVTSEIGDRTCECDALRTLQSDNELLVPQSGMIHNLSDVKPVYTAIFLFADRAGDLRLSATWHEADSFDSDDGTALEELSKSWVRLDRDTDAASSLVNLSLCDLRDGSAWQFDLLSSHAVEDGRLAQELVRFADSIRIDTNAARQQRIDTPFVRYNPYAPLKSLQQRTSFRYGFANSDYTLELTRFQDRVFKQKGSVLGDSEVTVYEPRWSLEVYRSQWSTMFSRNEHLAVGMAADWHDGVEVWFPEDDTADIDQKKGEQGFEQLIAKLGMIKKLVLRNEEGERRI